MPKVEEEAQHLSRRIEGLVEGRILSGPRRHTTPTYVPPGIPRYSDIGTSRSLEDLPDAKTRLLVAHNP
jgi:hypothetical protein